MLEILHGSEEHLEEGSPAPNGCHPPGGEVDVGQVGEILVELTMKVVGSLWQTKVGNIKVFLILSARTMVTVVVCVCECVCLVPH